jgi:hypothetical protein
MKRKIKSSPANESIVATPSPSLPVSQSPSLFFLALWLLLLLAGRTAMLNDPGTFWHVAAGGKMLATGQLIRTDSFSFTMAGRPWIDDQWLAEIGMAAIHRVAGWGGLLLLTATLLAGFFAWITARLLRGGLHFLPAVLLLAVTMTACSPQFHVRPLIVTMILLGATFALLVDVESGARRFRRLWLLVPLFIFWTNIHGGVLAGLGTVTLWLVGSCVTDHSLKRIVKTLILLAALAVTTLCNPYGIHLPWEWWETLTMPLPSLIVEHGRLNLLEPIGMASEALLAVYLTVLFGVFPKRPRVVWLLPLVWFVLAMLRLRNAPLFAITAAIAIIDMLPHSRVGAWLARRDLFFAPRPPAGWRAIVLPTVFVAVAVAVQLAGVRMPLIGRDWAEFPTTRWPMELLPELDAVAAEAKSAKPDAASRRIFNDMNFGGFLIFFEPDLRVFIDDRCSVYGGRFLSDYDRARCDDPEQIERWRRQYGFGHALVIADGRFDRYLSDSADWTLVARTPAAALYRHR